MYTHTLLFNAESIYEKRERSDDAFFSSLFSFAPRAATCRRGFIKRKRESWRGDVLPIARAPKYKRPMRGREKAQPQRGRLLSPPTLNNEIVSRCKGSKFVPKCAVRGIICTLHLLHSANTKGP